MRINFDASVRSRCRHVASLASAPHGVLKMLVGHQSLYVCGVRIAVSNRLDGGKCAMHSWFVLDGVGGANWMRIRSICSVSGWSSTRHSRRKSKRSKPNNSICSSSIACHPIVIIIRYFMLGSREMCLREKCHISCQRICISHDNHRACHRFHPARI